MAALASWLATVASTRPASHPSHAAQSRPRRPNLVPMVVEPGAFRCVSSSSETGPSLRAPHLLAVAHHLLAVAHHLLAVARQLLLRSCHCCPTCPAATPLLLLMSFRTTNHTCPSLRPACPVAGELLDHELLPQPRLSCCPACPVAGELWDHESPLAGSLLDHESHLPRLSHSSGAGSGGAACSHPFSRARFAHSACLAHTGSTGAGPICCNIAWMKSRRHCAGACSNLHFSPLRHPLAVPKNLHATATTIFESLGQTCYGLDNEYT